MYSIAKINSLFNEGIEEKIKFLVSFKTLFILSTADQRIIRKGIINIFPNLPFDILSDSYVIEETCSGRSDTIPKGSNG